MTCLQIDILSVTIQVCSNSTAVLTKLKELLGFFTVHDLADPEARSARVLFEAQLNQGNCSLYRNGKLTLETDHLAYFIASLEFKIFEEVLSLEKEHLLLHAGALTFEGKGLIFPAAKGAGKSTLVAGLLSHGFMYCSDEPAAINFQSRKLIPLPRVIHIKDTSPLDRSIAEGSLSMAAYDDGPSDYPARYALVGQDRVVRRPVELACILFPHYKPGGRAKLTPLRGSQTAVRLARQALNLAEQLERGFDLTATIASDKPAYQLEFNSLPEAAELICNIMV
ncbi:MAG: hypothetical protein JRJ87_19275 [Deltaproteobacteria bacterium]|nr:hypothetical protein [Deltaproteobacteria bacterium]